MSDPRNSDDSARRERFTDSLFGNAPGPATGLYRSLTSLFATVVALAQTRLELLTTELQEEVQRAAALAIWGFVALLAGVICLVMGGLTIVFVFWDTHRVLAAVLVSASFLAIAIIAILVLVVKANSREPFLNATLGELAKDSEALKQRLERD